MVANVFNVSIFWADTIRDIRSDNLDRIWNKSILQSFEEYVQAHCQWNEDAKAAFPYQLTHLTSDDRLNEKSISAAEYHKYRGFWSGSLWNKHRSAIISLNHALLERLAAAKSNAVNMDFTTTNMIDELHHKATVTIQTMIRDIFASIPFCLGDIPPYTSVSPQCKSSATGPPKSVGGYLLIWPLIVILHCPIASETQRDQARAALIRIGRQFGIVSAIKWGQNYTTTAEDALLPDARIDVLPDSFNRYMLGQ